MLAKNITAGINSGINQTCRVGLNNSSRIPYELLTKMHCFYSICENITSDLEIPGGAQILVLAHTKACTRGHGPTTKADRHLELHGRSAEKPVFCFSNFKLAVIASKTDPGAPWTEELRPARQRLPLAAT
jgi:hypothetical protein